MIIKILTFIFLIVNVSSASAQLTATGVGGGFGGTAVTYVGPGDVKSGAVFFFSCRAYSAAVAGTKAYRLVRASDSAQTDINSLANGLCDTTTPTTFCNATTCKYVTWYDQTGALACAGGTACDVTQGTDAQRYPWVASTLGGYPCANSPTPLANWGYYSANNLTFAVPATLTGVANFVASSNIERLVTVGNAGTAANRIAHSASNQVNVNFGTSLAAAATDGSPYALIGVGNGASSAIVVNGAATTGAAGSASITSFVGFLNDQNNSPVIGNGCEAGGWPVAFNATEYGNMTTNMRSAAYGWNF